jgi:hypothetical protein
MRKCFCHKISDVELTLPLASCVSESRKHSPGYLHFVRYERVAYAIYDVP